MEKPKLKRLLSLTQSEVIGLDDDEFIQINVTQLKKKFFLFIVSFGYMLNGFSVGWSSNISSMDIGCDSCSPLFSQNQISWIISAFPFGVVIMSIILCKFYYVIGTKASILSASLFIIISWLVIFIYGGAFEMLITARFVAGLGSGVIFILSGVYLKELMGAHYNRRIVDLLITQFGLGIFLQYFLDLTTDMEPSLMAIILSSLFFILCCFLPESPRYTAYCDMKSNDSDFGKAVMLNKFWGKEDLQRKSIVDLFDELKKLNLLPLMGLILVEQFIGGISLLFYMKHFAQLTGGQFSPELISTAVGLTLIVSIPMSRICRFSKISTTKRQIITSTSVILLCMICLAIFCITEGSIGHRLEFRGLNHIPMLIFIVMTFFNLVGISRNSLMIVQHVLTSYSLQLHLKTVSIAVTWFFIFIITKLLPQTLYSVGVGYFYFFMAIIVLIALTFLCKIMPTSFNLECEVDEDAKVKNAMDTSIIGISTVSIETPSTNHSSESSSQNEMSHVETF